MKFYIDFEANQPENEIIAVGVVSETGKAFYSLVKPQMSKLAPYVSELTHIAAEDLEKAETIDQVFTKLDMWIWEQEADVIKWDIISYGDDNKFIKATLPTITDEHAFTLAAILMAKIRDCSKDTFKFFHGSISLIHAFNYVQAMEIKQNHNPLEDAMMLQKVYEYTINNEPLTKHPLHVENTVEDVKMPSGTFWCKHVNGGKNGKIRNFATCDDAIDWLITDIMKAKDPELIHRDRIMTNIMKAVRKRTSYCNYKWGRVKEEEVTND